MISNGVDIIRISRFDKLKINKNFMIKVFRDEEIEYIKKHNNNSETIAGLFACKESFLKTIKKGINDYALTDIEVAHDKSSAPYLILHDSLSTLKYKSISVSISHDGDYAIAACIIQY